MYEAVGGRASLMGSTFPDRLGFLSEQQLQYRVSDRYNIFPTSTYSGGDFCSRTLVKSVERFDLFCTTRFCFFRTGRLSIPYCAEQGVLGKIRSRERERERERERDPIENVTLDCFYY